MKTFLIILGVIFLLMIVFGIIILALAKWFSSPANEFEEKDPNYE
jgi:hypothetical protein